MATLLTIIRLMNIMYVSSVGTLTGGLQVIPRFRWQHKTQGNCLPLFVSLGIICIFQVSLSQLINIKSVQVIYVVFDNKHVLVECALKIKGNNLTNPIFRKGLHTYPFH